MSHTQVCERFMRPNQCVCNYELSRTPLGKAWQDGYNSALEELLNAWSER